MDERKKIRNCPHCGGDAALLSDYSRNRDEYLIFGSCKVCGARGKIFYSWKDPRESDWDSDACNNALSAWNMRTNGGKTTWQN